MAEFKLYQDKTGEFRWRLRADNAEIVAVSSEGYKGKKDAINGIHLVKDGPIGYEVYEDDAGAFRWRGKHANGNIITTAGQGYSERADCEHGLELVRKLAPNAPVNDESLEPA